MTLVTQNITPKSRPNQSGSEKDKISGDKIAFIPSYNSSKHEKDNNKIAISPINKTSRDPIGNYIAGPTSRHVLLITRFINC